jgi:hypothetical protein
MTYVIRLINDNSMQTLYSGNSAKAAQKAVDMARGILIISGGTAGIYGHVWGKTALLWEVNDGQATCPEGTSPLA